MATGDALAADEAMPSGAQRKPSLVRAPTGTVAVRQLGGEWQDVQADEDGRHVVEVNQGGRIDVQLRSAATSYQPYQEVQGQRRLLPLGSSFDAKAGIFYWQPDEALLGDFDLIFETTSGSVVQVRVVVK